MYLNVTTWFRQLDTPHFTRFCTAYGLIANGHDAPVGQSRNKVDMLIQITSTG